MTRTFVVVILVLAATRALAQAPVGCDKFKWPLDRERTLLENPSQLSSGAEMARPLAMAVTVALVPLANAKLPVTPSRPPKVADSYAGFINAPALSKPGTYRVTLSAPAWIDVIQNGRALQSTAFSSVRGCTGMAKSVKFELGAASFSIELTGSAAHEISFVVTPD